LIDAGYGRRRQRSGRPVWATPPRATRSVCKPDRRNRSSPPRL